MELIEQLKFKNARKAFQKERESFYDDLAEAIGDKENVKDFLTSQQALCRKNGKDGLAKLYGVMLTRMDEEEGKFSHILEPIVPLSDLLSLAAIDQTHADDDRVASFRFLAQNIRNTRMMRATLLKSMITPIVVTPVIIAFALIISLFFVPEYVKVASPDKWPLIGQILYGISYSITNYGILIGAASVALCYGFAWTFPNWTGERRAKWDNYFPYKLYRDYQSANFLVALASLMQAKKTLVEALNLLKEQANPWLTWHIRKILQNLDDTPDDYSSAFDTGVLSTELHMRLSNYARRSSFTAGLTRLGTDGINHVRMSVEKSSSKMNLIAIFVTVFVILFFYGGNLMIGSATRKMMMQEVSAIQ